MKIRAYFISFMVVFASTLLTNHAHAKCVPESDYTPILEQKLNTLLYRLEPCDTNHKVGYLFGTFHSDSPALQPITKKAARYIYETDAAAFEVVLDEELQRRTIQISLLPKEHKGLFTLMNETRYKQLRALAKRTGAIPIEALSRLKPWAAAIILQYPIPENDGLVVDKRLQQMASAEGKPIFALEDIHDQFDVFENLSVDEQLSFLFYTLDSFQRLKSMELSLKRAYLSGDLEKIQHVGTEALLDIPQETLSQYISEELIEKRNHNMTKRALDKLQTMSLFIAVGALHLPGDDGMLSLLEAEGYQIHPVKLTAETGTP